MIVMISSLSCICLVVGKKVSKGPKIQRLVTPLTLQRKRARIADKKRIAKAKSEAAEYQKLLASKKISNLERVTRSLDLARCMKPTEPRSRFKLSSA
ncbi:hypothetical protein JHK85_006406 [Glycine max]|nr:hypothetical protein JHK87_006083 [Glycine soja]KAG5053896.1 hypothetical protein JHK85_006406 [Glycine max]